MTTQTIEKRALRFPALTLEQGGLQISRSLKRLIYWELGIPLALLSIGIYHGLMQVIYRAGVLQQPAFAKLDYYQGLTLHGVINAIVLTTFSLLLLVTPL
jgi:heme/copper-type cytochrome/quinol oxidase subunit 1